MYTSSITLCNLLCERVYCMTACTCVCVCFTCISSAERSPDASVSSLANSGAHEPTPQQSQQSPEVQTRLLTELAYAGAVANEADSQDMLNAVIVTLPAIPSGRERRQPCTVLITAKAVPSAGELLVDYGDDQDEAWQHRQ